MVQVLFSACTVTPSKLKDKVASFDGGVLNSGFLGFTNDIVPPSTEVERFGMITPNAYGRYMALAQEYGPRFTPPLSLQGRGTPEYRGDFKGHGYYLIDKQHLVYFQTMNRWRKEGK